MNNNQIEMIFQIKGMDCAGCAQTVEKGVSQLPGVAVCSLNFSTEKLRVAGEVRPEAVVARVRELGYEVDEPQANTSSTLRPGSGEPSFRTSPSTSLRTSAAVPADSTNFFGFMWQRHDTRLALLGLLLILPGLILEELLGLHHPLVDLASIGAVVVAGLPVARSAWRALRINREININVLM